MTASKALYMGEIRIVRSAKTMNWDFIGTSTGIGFLWRTRVGGFVAGILITLVGDAGATTVTAKSVSFADVRSAIGLARDGDTVVVPAGTADWTATLTITKGITLQGAGTAQTVITDNIVKGPTNYSEAVLDFNTTSFFRLTGFTFTAGSPTRRKYFNGVIQTHPTVPTFRVDHCDFYHLRNDAVTVNAERGVVDHNTFELKTNGGVYVTHYFWGGGDKWGDTSWSTALNLGGDHAVFVETNTFTNDANVADATAAFGSLAAGARFVIRYNTLHDCQVSCHGTESSGRARGARSWEIYNNTFDMLHLPGWPQPIGLLRSGTGVIWGNTVTGKYKHFCMLACGRQAGYFKCWGGADGLSGWDVNDTSDHKGNGYGGGSSGLYGSGTHTGANGSTTLVVSIGSPGNSAPGWTTNQWVGYEFLNTTQHNVSVCSSNTNNTITYIASFGPNGLMKWNTGDHFEIRKVIQSLDQPGASTSDLLTDQSQVPTPVNLHQRIEPIYGWNNTFNGDPGLITTGYNIIAGRDFINNGSTPKPGYKPYTYPHPLVSGASPPASRPTSGHVRKKIQGE